MEQVTLYILYSVSSHMNDEAGTKAFLNGLVCSASSRTCDREKSLLSIFLMSGECERETEALHHSVAPRASSVFQNLGCWKGKVNERCEGGFCSILIKKKILLWLRPIIIFKIWLLLLQCHKLLVCEVTGLLTLSMQSLIPLWQKAPNCCL